MKKQSVLNIIVIIVIAGLVTTTGCNNTGFEIKKETKAINDIFKQLTDSIVYYRQFPIPPPPPLQSDIKENDDLSSGQIQSLKEYNKLMSSIDTNRHVISIFDTLLSSSIRLSETISKFKTSVIYYDYFGAFDSYLENNKKALFFNLNEIKNTGKYELIYYSEISKQLIKGKYPELKFYYYGSITFTRVYMNKEETNGFLECNLRCGQDCHYDFILLIKKAEMNWRIDRIILIGVA
ncbi:MAG TPA: hypothetical protein PLC59_01180 [Bacteroidales bacterium]|nr:hypothetical protein [Bacteroidales bacterium]